MSVGIAVSGTGARNFTQAQNHNRPSTPRSALLVFVVSSPPDARLVPPLGRAVEPVVHAKEGVYAARIGGVGVVDGAVIEHERAHAWPIARVPGCISPAH